MFAVSLISANSLFISFLPLSLSLIHYPFPRLFDEYFNELFLAFLYSNTCIYSSLLGPALAEFHKLYIIFQCHSFWNIFLFTDVLIPILTSSSTCGSLRNVLPAVKPLWIF